MTRSERPGPVKSPKSIRTTNSSGLENLKVPSLPSRLCVLAAGLLVIVGLASTSTTWRVVMAPSTWRWPFGLASSSHPAMKPAEIQDMQTRFVALGCGFSGGPLSVPWLTGADGRQDQPHFCFYPMLALPEVWLLKLFGLPPYYAFTLLNSGLLLGALWVVSASLVWRVLRLLFLSPVIWWIDKAHTEVFTFSLLAIAMTTMVDRPW